MIINIVYTYFAETDNEIWNYHFLIAIIDKKGKSCVEILHVFSSFIGVNIY